MEEHADELAALESLDNGAVAAWTCVATHCVLMQDHVS